MDHLWTAVLHQGTPWPATAPSALVVTGLLGDRYLNAEVQASRLGGPELATRVQLVRWLTEVIASAAPSGVSLDELKAWSAGWMGDDFSLAANLSDDDAEKAMKAMFARSTLACREAAPTIADELLLMLDAPDSELRAAAGDAVAKMAQLPAWHERAGKIVSRLTDGAVRSESVDERCAFVVAIGELGGDTLAFLGDANQAVRACAALGAPYVPEALDELLDALRDPMQVDSWFVVRPPQFDMRPRFSFLRSAIDRASSFRDLLEVPVAIAKATSKPCVDPEWGPLLVAAFPSHDDRTQLDESLRAYLRALCENEASGTLGTATRRTGSSVPDSRYDRKQCLRIVKKGRR